MYMHLLLASWSHFSLHVARLGLGDLFLPLLCDVVMSCEIEGREGHGYRAGRACR